MVDTPLCVRMAEGSKAPDLSVSSFLGKGNSGLHVGGVGSNPTPDTYPVIRCFFFFHFSLLYSVVCEEN